MNGLEIAIIGMSGRYARSKNVDKFWQHLVNGEELTTVFPNWKSEDKTVKAGSVLEDVEMFDASFFGVNPREAEMMDPQHRMFLECAWEALENAGYNSEEETKAIAVYAGVGISTYLLYNLFPNKELMSSVGTLQSLIGFDKDYLPSRVSYKLNLKGPSVSVGTACSSSLVAVHLACQSLLSGECDMALAAGVSVKVPQNELTLSPGGIISPDGHCRAFDAGANGTLGGNGIGVVVLKRLEEAIRDRDNIYAVVKGSAINNDGAEKIGYTAPSEKGQAEVIRAAQIMAEVEPETITYMEAHGTGTALGDPIEIAAMTKAFRLNTNKNNYCAIGSVKTNVGHLDAAAGITGLIKTAMALKHKVLPPSLNFETPNPQIDFENSPFFVNSKLSEWKSDLIPRRAGVSSFGIGGTNAHLILEEAPPVEVGGGAASRSPQLLLLSARTNSALEAATKNLSNYLKNNVTLPLGDVAYTLQVGRKALEHRRIVVVKDTEDAAVTLEKNDPERILTCFAESANRPVVFMFSGQGSQYASMGRDLYETEAVFREECDRCWQLLEARLPDLKLNWLSLSDEQLNQTAIAQPALFVIEYALAKLWMSWGVRPTAAIGHSIGEYVAATLAGVFSLEDALMLVATRGRLMQEMPAGAMLSVNLPAAEVASLVEETGMAGLEVAASNAPSLSAVSGSFDAIEKLENLLAAREIFCRRLHTSHGFHSQSMEGAIAPFTEAVKKVKLNPPQMPFVSNVTGTWILPEEAIAPIYWGRHLRQPVRFAEGMAELLKDPERVFVEVGPGRALTTLVKKQAGERIVLSSLRHPKDEQSDTTFLLNTLGKLWLAGVKVDWLGFYATEERCRIPLPTYPFERKRYWVEGEAEVGSQESGVGSQIENLSKKPDISDWFYVPSWKHEILPSADLSNCKRWLVFVDDSEFCSAFCERLSSQYSVEVIQVKIGDKFQRIKDGFYTINPGIKENYELLLNEVLGLGEIQNISHFWSLMPAKTYEEYQKLGFYSLLYLAQVLNSKNSSSLLQIGVISSQIQKITGTEKIIPEKATILGACKAIPLELFNVNCRLIDIEKSDVDRNISAIKIDRLIIELAADFNASVVAYRSGKRWVETFDSISLEPVSENKRLREKGVYLITGGMGGIGLAIAEYLAETVRAKLVLIGRSDFPPKSEWENLLKTGENNGAIDKIKKLQNLEKLGAEVLIIKTDVTNKEQMQTAVNRVSEKFGNIHGIIHAAGTVGRSLIKSKTPETVEQIFAPKVQGTLVIDEIFRDTKLDFLVFCSSFTSIIGMTGQIDYSGANAFMDKFSSGKTDTFTVSINWSLWNEVGMSVNVKVPEGSRKRHEEGLKQQGFNNQEGVEAFSRILNGDKLQLNSLSQIVVSALDFQAMIEKYVTRKPKIQQTTEQKSLSNSAHQRPNLANAYVKPRNEMEEKVASLFERLIGIKKVGIYDNFFELGGDSLLVTQINSQLREMFHVEIGMEDFFDMPTVAGISDKIQGDRLAGNQVQAQKIVPVAREAYRVKLND